LSNGILAGVEGAERAASHAGEEWKREALAAFEQFANANDTFTTEDVRNAGVCSDPPDNRAWGQVALAAQRKGSVKPVGYQRVKSSNGRPATLWQKNAASI
jgi:hypothetical protein